MSQLMKESGANALKSGTAVCFLESTGHIGDGEYAVLYRVSKLQASRGLLPVAVACSYLMACRLPLLA
jgi:hypothetical protein